MVSGSFLECKEEEEKTQRRDVWLKAIKVKERSNVASLRRRDIPAIPVS